MPTKYKKSESIDISGITIELIRSKRKTLSLEVGNNGIKARAPLRMSKAVIIDFIISKQHWLQQRINERPAPVKKKALINGTQLLFENKEINLNIVEGKRGSITFKNDQLNLPVIKSNLLLSDTVKTKLVKWYKKQALRKIEQRISYFAPIMGVKRSIKNTVKVREYKRRWGSCDQKGDLSFNWRIIKAPSQTLDYVVIHELAHCHEFNHSKRFWSIVTEQMPEWKQHHNWLERNGSLLYQF